MAIKVKVSTGGISRNMSLEESKRLYSALEGSSLEDLSKLDEFIAAGGSSGDIAKAVLEEAEKTKSMLELPELPMPEGEQERLAKRRSLLKQRKRRGRESTILSSPVSLLSEEIGV